MYEAKTIRLCGYCIMALRSRGEMIYVGEESETETECEWCNEDDDVTYECIFL